MTLNGKNELQASCKVDANDTKLLCIERLYLDSIELGAYMLF